MRGRVGLLALLVLSGCSSTPSAPVVERSPVAAPVAQPAAPVAPAVAPAAPPGSYTIRRGDTLYSIALDNGLDYRDVAAWNGITDPNVIREGQSLTLTPPASDVQVRPVTGLGGVQVRPLGESQPVRPAVPSAPPGAPADLVTEPKALKLPYSEENLALLSRPAAPASKPQTAPVAPPSPPAATAPARPEPERAKTEPAEDAVDWSWPASGKIVAGFSEPASKGVDIAGKKGEPVNASAGGRVVYVGEGLRGYGKLVIIKHNNTFLSAYAHNDTILVKEGQTVVKGQKIAEIGSTGTDQPKLHFEIRQLGKPVDPLKFLPERPS